MKQYLEAKLPANEEINTIIIGGGIVGASLFRDLALHGKEVLLINKGDFGSQTSWRSSKMLHGGIRYLEHAELGLVREALVEKNRWLKLASHLCYEEPFCMPVYKDSKYPFLIYNMGFKIYDFLSAYTNSPHRILWKKETLKEFPLLQDKGLKGSGIYFDAIVDDVKLTLECIYDGLLEENSYAANHFEVSEILKTDNKYTVKMIDQLGQKEYTYIAKNVVFATGPFTDQLMHKLKLPWKDRLAPSKGIHLWLDPEALPLKNPVVLQTADQRIIFVIPQKEAVLVGTTESKTDEDFFNIEAKPEEIDYLMENLKTYFPKADLNHDHIISTFAGIRPLVKSGGLVGKLGKLSRKHKVFTIMPNMHAIVGGKLTTFRTMVQSLARNICTKEGTKYDNKKALLEFRQTSTIPPFEKIQITEETINNILQNEKVRTFDDLIARRIGVPDKLCQYKISKEQIHQTFENYTQF
ncbi:MAG: glycerol-3-phosphate dehydrogenase/oxidase [Bacteriovoracia bacterium]